VIIKIILCQLSQNRKREEEKVQAVDLPGMGDMVIVILLHHLFQHRKRHQEVLAVDLLGIEVLIPAILPHQFSQYQKIKYEVPFEARQGIGVVVLAIPLYQISQYRKKGLGVRAEHPQETQAWLDRLSNELANYHHLPTAICAVHVQEYVGTK